MLVIREAQFRIFENELISALQRRICEKIRIIYPQLADTAGPESLIKMIRKGMERVRQLGADSEDGATGYIDLMCRLGSEFEHDARYSWAAAMLDDPFLPGEEKITLLFHRARLELGEAFGQPQILL
jgi:hypothetical protein